MKSYRTPVFVDRLELTLRIKIAEALEIYGRLNQNWNEDKDNNWMPKGTKHRYKYRYHICIDKAASLFIDLYTVPIGKGQSSIKLVFKPFNVNFKNVRLLRKELLKVLGLDNCLRLYREATVTRIDLAVDYKLLKLNSYHFFCKGRSQSVYNPPESLYLGSIRSELMCRIYQKDIQLFKKTGKKSKYPILRFEWTVRKRLPMCKLHEIGACFEMLYAYEFDADDPDFIKLFIESRADNQEHRARLIDKLKDDYLHEAIFQFSAGERSVILTALKPYRVDLFTDSNDWQKDLKRALGFIRQLKPKERRRQLKSVPPSAGHCEFNIPVDCYSQ
jgi:hypothetical protein